MLRESSFKNNEVLQKGYEENKTNVEMFDIISVMLHNLFSAVEFEFSDYNSDNRTWFSSFVLSKILKDSALADNNLIVDKQLVNLLEFLPKLDSFFKFVNSPKFIEQVDYILQEYNDKNFLNSSVKLNKLPLYDGLSNLMLVNKLPPYKELKNLFPFFEELEFYPNIERDFPYFAKLVAVNNFFKYGLKVELDNEKFLIKKLRFKFFDSFKLIKFRSESHLSFFLENTAFFVQGILALRQGRKSLKEFSREYNLWNKGFFKELKTLNVEAFSTQDNVVSDSVLTDRDKLLICNPSILEENRQNLVETFYKVMYEQNSGIYAAKLKEYTIVYEGKIFSLFDIFYGSGDLGLMKNYSVR